MLEDELPDEAPLQLRELQETFRWASSQGNSVGRALGEAVPGEAGPVKHWLAVGVLAAGFCVAVVLLFR